MVYLFLPLEVATPEHKPINSTLSSIYKKVRLKTVSAQDAVHPSCDSPNTSRRFVLGSSGICLVDENLT